MKRLLIRAYARQRLVSWNRDMARRRAREVEIAAWVAVFLLIAFCLAFSFGA